MARYISNQFIGPDYSEKELQELPLYKSVASLVELNPIFVHFEVGAEASNGGGSPNIGLIGTEKNYYVEEIHKLNETIPNKYVWEVSLIDVTITSYPRILDLGGGASVPVPQQALFIKLDNLTNQPYDFVCTQPIEKQNNRVIYLNQKSFPSALRIKYGHCNSDQKSPDFGTFYDFNQNVDSPLTTAPFRLFYNQSASIIRFRISIKQIHTF